MSAQYCLEHYKHLDIPGSKRITGVYLQDNPRRYYAVSADKSRHYFAASVSQVAAKRWGDPVDVQTAAMAIGTDAHRAIKCELSGLPGAYRTSSPEAQYALEAFRDWRASLPGTTSILASEGICWDLARDVAGTFDLLLRVNDETWLVDYKATEVDTIPSHYKLQLAGYSRLIADCGAPVVDRAIVLCLPKSPLTPWREVTVWDNDEHRIQLEFCFTIANQMRQNLELARKIQPVVRVGAVREMSEDELWEGWQ